ncbi:carbon-nitrogen hydrolase family protein [Stygiobacter electus]|jgi:predicted amidohydrolase/ribosomal protein S18 acetylase RimI-like enzyme|uniref:GNAT family N-acetyltransferase n=1 Tax=Stygiobacter electus TaxID=3032292 RepID=A0AAE3P445_9BACT|nr:GNAT family N-acetyltransferase [Stygiobacter electus]MDF1612550.1 GNAT family N-acetyltransferase [Stygiobacter electus]
MGKINLKNFEKSLIVRNLKKEDFEDVCNLQLKCFPGMPTWTKEQFESQIEIFPEGQICIEYQGKIVASSSSLILDFALYSEWHTWKEIADHGFIRNHNPQGNTLYGIEIMVDPKFRGLKLARRIYDARKQLARKYNLMRIILGGRIPGYHKYADKMSAKEYVEKVTNKILYDPVLTAQVSNGFVVKRIIPNYLSSDEESKGYATFLEWTNLDYVPDTTRIFEPKQTVRICAVQYQMRLINSFEEFAKQVEYFVDVASDYKCDFILFPEIFTTQLLSFLPNLRPALAMRQLSEFTPKYLELFNRLSLKYNINIIGGSHFTIEDENLFNISYLFRRDGTIDKQYKLHITPNEKRWWGVKPGNELKVFDTDKGKISIQICYDIEFPELSRIAAEKGAEIIFVPFCTDERYAYLRVRYCAQARCIENHVYVVIAGSVGNLPQVENLDIQYAQSAIFTPSDIPFTRDAIQSEATPNVETVIIDDVDLELLKKHKQSGSVLNWKDRRIDIYEVKHNL